MLRCDRTWHHRSPTSAKRSANELIKIVPVLLVAGPAAFRGEIILVPPMELSLGRQRHLVGFTATDQISTHGDHGLAALWPERRDDVGAVRAPQSKAARIAFSISRASIKAMMSRGTTDCWAFR